MNHVLLSCLLFSVVLQSCYGFLLIDDPITSLSGWPIKLNCVVNSYGTIFCNGASTCAQLGWNGDEGYIERSIENITQYTEFSFEFSIYLRSFDPTGQESDDYCYFQYHFDNDDWTTLTTHRLSDIRTTNFPTLVNPGGKTTLHIRFSTSSIEDAENCYISAFKLSVLTAEPTLTPTNNPSIPPTNIPTSVTSEPTFYPTNIPTALPTVTPTHNPTTIVPTTNIPSAQETSEPTIVNPTKTPTKEKKVDMTTTLIVAQNDAESNLTGTKSGSITVIVIIVVVIVTTLLIVIVFFYFKRRKKIMNKEKLAKNISNVEMIHGKIIVDDADIVTAINQTNMGSIQKSDDDIVAQVNQTDIGDNERSDEDLIGTVNATDIGVAINNTYMANIPPKVNKISSISNGDDLDEMNNNNEEEDLIETINNTAGANENDINEFVIDGDSENEKMIESEGVSYKLDEDGAKDVRLWLNSIGFNMYYDVLVQNGFDSMESIQEITDKNDLNDIGITLKGHQLKLIKYIKLSKTDQ